MKIYFTISCNPFAFRQCLISENQESRLAKAIFESFYFHDLIAKAMS